MKKYFVLTSDLERTGRGTRGLTLYKFLRTFAGKRAVSLCSPEQLQRRRFTHTDTLFIGVPTRLAPDSLSRVRYRRVVLFDYHDSPEAQWGHSDARWLTGLTDQYCKPWVETHWSTEFRWGCLPLKRPDKLKHRLRVQRVHNFLWGDRPAEKQFDVGFVGYPTALRTLAEGESATYPQRLEWLQELERDAYDRSFWGGLILNSQWRAAWSDGGASLKRVCFAGRRLRFNRYFRALRRCRVILTPAGNARWTYRHFEAVYAGATLLSTDLSRTRMLVPIPLDNAILVPDHQPIVPFLERALAIDDRTRQEAGRAAIGALEQNYFVGGDYSRSRPLPYERFNEQLRAA